MDFNPNAKRLISYHSGEPSVFICHSSLRELFEAFLKENELVLDTALVAGEFGVTIPLDKYSGDLSQEDGDTLVEKFLTQETIKDKRTSLENQ